MIYSAQFAWELIKTPSHHNVALTCSVLNAFKI